MSVSRVTGGNESSRPLSSLGSLPEDAADDVSSRKAATTGISEVSEEVAVVPEGEDLVPTTMEVPDGGLLTAVVPSATGPVIEVETVSGGRNRSLSLSRAAGTAELIVTTGHKENDDTATGSADRSVSTTGSVGELDSFASSSPSSRAILSWDVDRVIEWFSSLPADLVKYTDALRSERIDGPLLVSLVIFHPTADGFTCLAVLGARRAGRSDHLTN